MRRSACLLAAALLLASCAEAPPLSSSVIAIDVGHSRERPGATRARGVAEFQFNAALARELAATLARDRMSVVLIGGNGEMNGLEPRSAQARAAGAGFLLSIHHDSVKPEYLRPWQWQGAPQQYAEGPFSGFGLFVSRKNPRLIESLRCASAIGRALQQAGFRHSTYHADPVLGDGREWADEENGVYYYDNLVVLKTARQPAVLLEAGVIVNRDDEAALASGEARQKMARAIGAGLQACGVAERQG